MRAEGANQVLHDHRVLDIVERDFLRAHQQAAVIAGYAQTLERFRYPFGQLVEADPVTQVLEQMQDVDISLVFGFFKVEELVDGFQRIGAFLHVDCWHA